MAKFSGKIFCIGFYKTGTTSLYHALKILGYRTINGDKPGSYPGADDGASLIPQMDAGDYKLHTFEKFDAFTDAPYLWIWREIYPQFPEARYILTVRDEEPWLASCVRFYRGRRIRPMMIWQFGKHADPSHDEASRLGVEPPMILGVTVLTSIDQYALENDLRVPGNIDVHVVHLAKLAQKSGLDGVVSSPLEIEVLTEHLPGLRIITPGIRPGWAVEQDQKRIPTPADAIAKGAYALVIGRAITQPPQRVGGPVAAADKILKEIAAALT